MIYSITPTDDEEMMILWTSFKMKNGTIKKMLVAAIHVDMIEGDLVEAANAAGEVDITFAPVIKD